MDPVVTGGLIGVGGTLLGVVTQDGLARLRDRTNRRRLARRAVTAVVSELVATVSILDKALERQAWWPDGDEPRRNEWDRYRDALSEELDTETVMRISIVYDTIRSLAATRSTHSGNPGPSGEDTSSRSGRTILLEPYLDRRSLAVGGRGDMADSGGCVGDPD
jgi:hypothetical protein